VAASALRRREIGRFGRPAVALLAVTFGLLTLAKARHDPDGSFGGTSAVGGIAELGAGWCLVAVGLLFGHRHPRNLVGPLLVAAGLAWFLPEWSNPGVDTSIGFTAGLVGFLACAPLAVHAALAYPTGRLSSAADRAGVAFAYSGAVVLLGVLPAAVFDPGGSGCLQCPSNLVLVESDFGLYDTFNRWGLRLGLAWLAALGVLSLWRLTRTRGMLGVTAPVLLSAAVYLAVLAWYFQHSLAAGLLSNTAFDRRAWRYEAAALAALAFAVGLALLRERRARASVARLVVELADSPRPGGVRDALAAALHDETLELAYRRPGTDEFVDADGLALVVEAGPGRAVTPLRRGDVTVAAFVHDARLRDQPGLVGEAISAARLAVENEQLQAKVRAQLLDLRASRSRIVEAADDARRRLERDLHDGAQQRIVGLLLALQLLRSRLDPEDANRVRSVERAADELRCALDDLRDVAHGLYPSVLSDEGLAAAIETLSELSETPIRIEGLVEGRFAPLVENAAYFTVAEAVRGAATASVLVRQENGLLIVDVETDSADPERAARLVEIADRVGALDGRLTIHDTRVRAEVPCAS